ncbi:DUF3460 family protein [beta proteobacterium MWH-UniP1]
MALYESDITQFLRSLKEQKPHLEEAQLEGRALLWEKDPLDINELERTKAVKVKQKPYVYQTN